MRKIIVPVDFSSTSRDAYIFAREIAKEFNASLKVIHIYSGSFSTNQPLEIKEGMGRREVLIEKLDSFIADIPGAEEGTTMVSAKVETAVIHGFTVPQIVKEAKRSDAYMIVMGTTGNHDMVEKALGSVSTGVSQHSHCPVLLVPKSAQYQSFKNILYASNYESATETMLRQIIDFANIFRAAVHFIHVNEGKEDNFDAIEERIFDILFKGGEPAFAFNMAAIPGATVAKGLNQYAAENKIDLAVLVSQHRSFLDNILGKSLTKKMVLNTTIPLLVYPATA